MPNNPSKHSKLLWFHKNRIKILLWTVLTILPLTLVLLAYIGTYNTYSKVLFVEESGEYIKSFDTIENIDLIDLDFNWDTLKIPTFDDEGEVASTGYYQFKLTYSKVSSYDVTSVNITPVLQTNWLDYSTKGTTTKLTEGSNTSLLIPFNYELPVRTLLFIQVTDPILYMKVELNYTSAGAPVNKVYYVKIDLHDINPDQVLD